MKRRLLLPILIFLAIIATACSSDSADLTTQSSQNPDAELDEFITAEGSDDPLDTEVTSETPDALAAREDDTTDESQTDTDADGSDADGSDSEPVVDDEPEPGNDNDTEAPTCSAPAGEERYVDVALDDPDGGLNIRAEAGSSSDVVATAPRSAALVTSGTCTERGSTQWWEVSTFDGTATGWVSSNFLSENLVFNPGIGNTIDSPDLIGFTAATLDELAAMIADELGFDQDVTISQEGDIVGQDAQGGTVTYEMTGLRDDASNGYIVEFDFLVMRNDPVDGEITSYTTLGVTNAALCTRGVTEDGLCI